MTDAYTAQEQAALLKIAREALTVATAGGTPPLPELSALPPALAKERACFVTLHTRDGLLRGCTGVLAARQPLAHEVSHTAVQTAFHDPRFSALCADELPDVVIEISVLTPAQPLSFASPEALIRALRPHVDGVIMIAGGRRGTFLPQVWERAPDPEDFLDLLCNKMGLFPGCWRGSGVQVYTYHTVIIEEPVETDAS